MIPCSNPGAQYKAHAREIDAAIQRVLDNGRYVLGGEVSSLEREFSAFIGVDHGIGVGSGTEALHLALRACGVGPGDEVITVSHTAGATAAAIALCGASPVFVDIEPDYFTLDPSRLQAAVSERTKAVVVVHLYGQPADLEPILALAARLGIRVVEDCAQAHGALYRGRHVGAWGDVACFSFYPTKNLGAIGDGGMVVTSDDELAAEVRRLREYGWGDRYVSEVAGWNSRLDELQAAILRVKLPYLEDDNARRVQLAGQYDAALEALSVAGPKVRAGSTHVYHQYVVRTEQRDSLRKYLLEHQVQALVHYPVPLHLQPAYASHRVVGGLTVTEKSVGEILSLPMYPELQVTELETVVASLRDFHGVEAR